MEDNTNNQSLFPSGGLFAAAAVNLNETEEQSTDNQHNWLSNNSFKKDINIVNKLDDDGDESHLNKEHKKRKHKKERKKKSKKSRTKSPEIEVRKYKDDKYKDDRRDKSRDDKYKDDRRDRSRDDKYREDKRDRSRNDKYKDDKKNKSRDDEYREIKKDDQKYEKELIKIEDNSLFKIDKKGVDDNLFYDTLYAGDVPKYKINEFYKYKSNKAQRYFNFKLGKCLKVDNKSSEDKSSEKQTMIKLIDKTINENFIKLIDNKDIDQLINENQSSLNKIQDELIDLTDNIKYENEILFNRVKEFNSYLNQNPNDIDKWIEFIRFQDELKFELDETDLRKDKSIVSDLNLIEKKLLVVEKSLKLNPNNVKLMILKLELLKETIESDKLIEEWNNLIFIYPTNFDIIKNYFKFISTHISYFNVQNLNKFFSRYMIKIVQYQEGNLKSIRNSNLNQSIERSMLEILLLYTILLKQSGYIEKSIAIWQAIIEFNFNRPDSLNSDNMKLDNLKEFFEIFWSSGCARFGEKESLGWKHIADNKTTSSDNKTKLNNDKLLDDKENEIVLKFKDNKNQIWFEIELLREKYNWMTAKLHEDCDDLDHIVLFDDIVDCLFRFKDDKSYQDCLIYFLYFLNAIKLDNDIYKITESIKLPTFYLDNEEQFLNCGKNSKLLSPKYFNYDQRIKFIIMIYQQSMNLMEKRNSENYHQLVYYYLNFIIQNAKNLDKDQSRKLFKKILKNSLNCDKIIYWRLFVDLEIQLNEITSAKNIFNKILLMLINQSIKLTEYLSIIEDFIEFNLKINNIKLNMIDNNLKINDVLNGEKEIGNVILIFIYSILNSKKIDNLNEINSILQLKTKQKIEKQFNECLEQVSKIDNELNESINYYNQLNNNSINNLIYLISLQIYNHYFYGYLSNQSSFDTSIQSLNRTSKFINDQLIKLEKSIKSKFILNYLIENLYIKHLDLHLLHLKFNFSSLTSFNNLLNEAIERFPKNNYFLILLVNTESFRIINGQIERYTFKLCRKIYETNIEQWLFVIYFEMRRLSNIQQQSIGDLVDCFNSKKMNQDLKMIDHSGTYSSGLVIRIRNLFERALQVHNCVLLWRLYMHYEVNQNNLDYAKTIFYRAVQQCPWNKLLYMDGVKIFTINTTMDQIKSKNLNKSKLIQNVHNLNDVLDLMIEKQLRVRTAVEEVEFLIDNQANLT